MHQRVNVLGCEWTNGLLPVEHPESHGEETDGLSHLSSVDHQSWCGIYLTCQKNIWNSSFTKKHNI